VARRAGACDGTAPAAHRQVRASAPVENPKGSQSDFSTTAGATNTNPTGRDVAARFLDGLHRSHLFLIVAFACDTALMGVKANALARKRENFRTPHNAENRIPCLSK